MVSARTSDLVRDGAVPAREALVVGVDVVADHVGELVVGDDVLQPPSALARLKGRRAKVEERVHPRLSVKGAVTRVVGTIAEDEPRDEAEQHRGDD